MLTYQNIVGFACNKLMKGESQSTRHMQKEVLKILEFTLMNVKGLNFKDLIEINNKLKILDKELKWN